MKTPEDEAFDDLAKRQGDWGGGFSAKRAMAADKLREPAQEPYAFDWLPEGATHLGRLTVNVQYGGVLEMRTHAFKYEGGVLMVYRTDNDNEYPEWIDATKVFVHTNFQVFLIAPPQREWVGLTDEEIKDCLGPEAVRIPPGWSKLTRAIEAKLKEKNT